VRQCVTIAGAGSGTTFELFFNSKEGLLSAKCRLFVDVCGCQIAAAATREGLKRPRKCARGAGKKGDIDVDVDVDCDHTTHMPVQVFECVNSSSARRRSDVRQSRHALSDFVNQLRPDLERPVVWNFHYAPQRIFVVSTIRLSLKGRMPSSTLSN
jgi:hypothetical protein